MEDIRSTLDNLLNDMENFESEWSKKLEESYQKIQNICSQPKSKPINKRLKRLQTVADVEIENDDNLESSVKSRDNRNSADSESVCETTQQTGRPKRAAKLKTLDNLKEKPLRGKLRQPSILSDLSSVNNITVKKEKLSKLPDDDNDDRQQQKQNDKISKNEQQKQQKNIEKRKSDENVDANKENSKKVKIDDNSLEIIGPNDNAAVIELSDNEDVDKMPPPTILPPKKRIGRNRKNDKSTSDSISSSASKTSDTTASVSSKTIKAEKSSLDNNRRKSDASSTVKDVEIRLEKIKTEKYSSSSNESKKSIEKSKKGKKVVKPKIIKEENTEDKNESEKRNQNKSSSSSLSSLSTNSKKNSETERNNNDNRNSEESSKLFLRTTRNASKKKATSGDSVYEDALTDQINNNHDEKQNTDDNDNVNPNDSNESNKSDVVVRIKKLKIPIDSKDKTLNDDQMVVADKEIVKATKKTKATPLPLPRKTPPFVEPSPDKVIDATFVSAVSENGESDDVPITDATFVTNTAQQTFVVDKEKPQIIQTVDVQIKSKTNNTVGNAATTASPVNPENCNATFSVDVNVADNKALPKNKNHNKDNDEMSENSLMTEDDSHAEDGDGSDDSPLLKLIAKGKPKPKPKHKNELFSPFIQSPVKKKVAAFEKHANEAAAASPVPQRQTRTKTRLKQLQQQNEQGKESEETTKQHQSQQHIPEFNHHKQHELNQNQKNRTPILPSRLARILTPTQQSNVTPTLTNPLKKVLPSSTSKLQSLQKAFSSTSLASSKGSSLSQESCHNIEKSQSKSKLNNLLEEKKKIREMKIQQVLKTKEYRDKEREDRLKKNLEMKYEKTRKAELEKRKELQKNLKLYEEAQRKLEKQKLLEFEKTEAIRRDKELQEKINLAKEQMKMKLYQQQLLHQQQQAQQRLMQQKQQQKAHVKPIDKCRYDFDILNSDDSTDDEEKTSSKRPQPPIWSKSSVRQFHIERQAHLPAKIIDSFFSVQPMTPDLREIFPAIDPRYLKRNSSFVWKTPPRYSELPKY